jgi:hypothetical protein
MSINMTQDFSFETDCIKSFEKMLKTAVDIIFDKSSGNYTKFSIWGKEPYHWRDGSSYDRVYEDVPSMLQTEDGIALIDAERIYGGATLMKITGHEPDLDSAAEKAMSFRKEKSKPTRMWVATLSDYSGEFKKDRGDTYCNNREDMVWRAVEMMKAVTYQQMKDAIGDGYSYEFNRDDGHITIGYRMHVEPNCGWNNIFLSCVHAYYGK